MGFNFTPSPTTIHWNALIPNRYSICNHRKTVPLTSLRSQSITALIVTYMSSRVTSQRHHSHALVELPASATTVMLSWLPLVLTLPLWKKGDDNLSQFLITRVFSQAERWIRAVTHFEKTIECDVLCGICTPVQTSICACSYMCAYVHVSVCECDI